MHAVEPYRLGGARLGPHFVTLHWFAEAVVGPFRGWCPPNADGGSVTLEFKSGGGSSTQHLEFAEFSDESCLFCCPQGMGRLDFTTARGEFLLAQSVDVRLGFQALRLSLLAAFTAMALRQGGLVLHAATVLVDGQTHVVVGPSGAGKTTLANAQFSDAFLHDDIAILVQQPGWQVWRQSPVFAEPSPQVPWLSPVAAVHYLSADRSQTCAQRLTASDALGLVATQTVFAGGAAVHAMALALARLVQAVPVFRLAHCLNDGPDRVTSVLRAAVAAH